MKYAIVTLTWLESHAIKPLPEWRMSADGTKYIVHDNWLAPYADEEFTRYEYDSEELKTLLRSEEWIPAETDREYSRLLGLQRLDEQARTEIQTMDLTTAEMLSVKHLYPRWEDYIGGSLAADVKVLYRDHLYKVRQAVPVVLENQPPSVSTAALYEEINETASGTADDPIPYNNNMALEKDKYYSQYDKVYKCIRSTEIPVYADLVDLVGNYVEEMKN